MAKTTKKSEKKLYVTYHIEVSESKPEKDGYLTNETKSAKGNFRATKSNIIPKLNELLRSV
jgi:hypothetical protein